MPKAEPGGQPKFDSWLDAADSVKLGPPTGAAPRVRPLDRWLLGSPRIMHFKGRCLLCEHCGRPVLQSVYRLHTADCDQNPKSGAWAERQRSERAAAEAAAAAEAEAARERGGVTGFASSLETSDATGSESDSRRSTVTANGRKRRVEDGLSARSARETPVLAAAAAVSSATAGTRAGSPSLNGAAPQASGDGPPKKKAKRVPKTRAREPYHPDKHCGVILTSGLPCARSLTCKVHSMGSKRAVVGRSQAFDVLLSAYQRETVARQAAAAAVSDRDAANAAAAAAEDSPDEPFSPEREVNAVIEGVHRSHCFPLYRRVVLRTRSVIHGFRMREMLALALLPKGASAGSDGIFGRTLVYRPDAPHQGKYVRASMIQRYVSAVQAQQRRVQQAQAQAQAQAQVQVQAQGGRVAAQTTVAQQAAYARAQAQAKLRQRAERK